MFQISFLLNLLQATQETALPLHLEQGLGPLVQPGDEPLQGEAGPAEAPGDGLQEDQATGAVRQAPDSQGHSHQLAVSG